MSDEVVSSLISLLGKSHNSISAIEYSINSWLVVLIVNLGYF